MEYKFEKSKHVHTLDGKPLIGVTTALSVISKPALIQWAANMACDYVESKFKDTKFPVAVDEDIFKWIKEARTAHRTKKEKAGDWGTIVHKAIEDWVKDGKVPSLEGTQQMAFDHFREWATTNNVEFLESEKHLYSKELWIGGICDLVIKMNGKKYVADIKTSSAIYNEHFFQMAGYGLMLRELGHNDIDGYIVINLKKDGQIDTKIAYDMALNEQAFLHALGLYKIINSLEK